ERTGLDAPWNRDDPPNRAALANLLAGELTVDRALQIALLNNQSLQATYEELGIAQADAIEAVVPRNPTLAVEVRFPSHVRLPFEVELSQSLIDLLLMPIRKRAGEAAFAAARLRVTQEALDVVAEVKASFYRAQGAAQLVEMRQTIAQA